MTNRILESSKAFLMIYIHEMCRSLFRCSNCYNSKLYRRLLIPPTHHCVSIFFLIFYYEYTHTITLINQIIFKYKLFICTCLLLLLGQYNKEVTCIQSAGEIKNENNKINKWIIQTHKNSKTIIVLAYKKGE